MYAIEMSSISKSFNKVTVLDDIDFTLKIGEIKGLVGKNGAGKSTLLKIIQGIHDPSAGTIKINGAEIPRNASKTDRAQMVSMIFQDFSLIPELTVVQNIFLNHEPLKGFMIDEKHCYQTVENFFKKYNINIRPDQKIKQLSTSDMQMVEISKAVIKNSKIILMDEPTAALDDEQTEKLFQMINKLKAEGLSIVLITHHLKEITKMCDSVTVLRDGKIVLSKEIGDTTLTEIINGMLGQENNELRTRPTRDHIRKDSPLMEVRSIVSKKRDKPISFEVYPGEIVGIAGLMGSGRTELFNNLFGIDPIMQGDAIVRGKKLSINKPKDALLGGIFLVPENRQTLGLSVEHSLYLNIQLPWMHKIRKGLLINDKQGKSIAEALVSRLHIKTNGIHTLVKNLSGGNQQKVVIGKALATEPAILLLDDPTYGVDVHAKVEIMKVIDKFVQAGGAVILVSSDMEELVNNSTRILIMKDFEFAGEIEDEAGINQENITALIQ